RCDTETIVHAFEEYGPSCVEKFRGMFAFAIWDANQQTLFCARDRLGIKPLYYYVSDKLFAFASEIKALLKLPEIPTQFEDTLLPEYLTFGYVSSDKTLFKGIRKLMPGHTLTVNAGTGTVQVKRYWDVPESSAVSGRSDEAWIRECRERLEQTVQMRLMSDVPLGMFLSGGVDSSAIAALMKRMRTEPVKTFAVGYEEAAYSELSYARQVSKAIGTDHHEIVIGPDDFFNALPRLIWHEDEPISWPSSVSLYFVSHLASQQVKVVLTGEGSDELFAGYYRYQHYLFNRRWADLYKFVPPFLRKGLRHYIDCSGLFSADLRRKLQHTFIGRDLNVESLQLDNFYGAFSAAERRNMLSGDLQNPYQTYLDYWQSRKGSVLSQMLYADQKTYLVELLMKQDQMSMACSIESRVPFLDHPFVEFASQVPDNLKIRGKTGKYIVKRAVEDLLPHEIIYRKKMGFPTPLRQWFREKKCEPLFASLLDRKGFLAEYLNLDYVRDLIGRQRSGADDATDRLWRLLNLHIWGNTFFTGKRDQNWDGLFESRLTKELV
ncbi:MAG: asparagine synthase (glutamine-hydrolyzing), partial [Acidobacteriaceae bacterium]|nr:asparagine synthase (glutamine-hydrolyzing) [Acidobacteriaceae bacterium]